MRALIAAACVAVVAFVGYFFWGEWSHRDHDLAANFQERCEQARNAKREEIEAFSRDEASRFRQLSEQCLDFLRHGTVP